MNKLRMISTASFFLILALAHNVPAVEAKENRELYTSILRFAEVDDNLYRGGQPNETDLLLLKKHGIKTIINFRAEKNLVKKEKEQVEKVGLEYIHLPWTIYGPYKQDVFDRFFELAKNKDTNPIFFHCKRGSERTGVIASAYNMKYKGMSYDAALTDAKQFDIKPLWFFFVTAKLEEFRKTLPEKH